MRNAISALMDLTFKADLAPSRILIKASYWQCIPEGYCHRPRPDDFQGGMESLASIFQNCRDAGVACTINTTSSSLSAIPRLAMPESES